MLLRIDIAIFFFIRYPILFYRRENRLENIVSANHYPLKGI